jgi:hypothetical protein
MCQRLICSPVVVVVALGVEEGLVPMPQLAGSCNAQSGVAAWTMLQRVLDLCQLTQHGSTSGTEEVGHAS